MGQRLKPANQPKVGEWISDNIVTLIFVVFIIFGFAVSSGVSLNFFLNELMDRIFRNSFLVISLIIPVIAGLGLNFGIVVGAMAGQIAIVIVRYFNLGGISGLMLCFLIALPLAMLFGYFTGRLYNKTRGQEMIASLMVGYFANGLYQFLFLVAVGVIIKVPKNHPLIKPDGIGVRMTVDLVPVADGGLKYALSNIWKIPFMWAVIVVAVGILALLFFRIMSQKKHKITTTKGQQISTGVNVVACIAVILYSIFAIVTKAPITKVKEVPVITGLLIVGFCVFTELLLKTKLGQDFKSVGQSQHISEVSGINVDRTRIIAVMISTVLAAWGMIIYLQDMGTLNTYNAHTNIGMFAVASILVGGASTSKANIKNALIGVVLFNAMFIMSPEIGQAVFGQALLGEYFRTFMAYGVIGAALGLYVWKANKKGVQTLDTADE
ncbi:MAG: ABC transporter permease [Oscillospiraceae bacterium]